MKKETRQKSKRRALTLIELVVVVIIIGILAGLAIPRYTRSREKAIDKQAQAILGLIRAAERVYFMELGHYYPLSGNIYSVDTINSMINLDLIDDGNWGYNLAPGFSATLSRNAGGYNRSWMINATMSNATCSPPSGCP